MSEDAPPKQEPPEAVPGFGASRRPKNLLAVLEGCRRRAAHTLAALVWWAERAGWEPLPELHIRFDGRTFEGKTTGSLPRGGRITHASSWPVTALGWTGEARLSIDLTTLEWRRALHSQPDWARAALLAHLARLPVMVLTREDFERVNPERSYHADGSEVIQPLYLSPPSLHHSDHALEMAAWMLVQPSLAPLELRPEGGR